jgi:thioredoxin 1
MIEVTNDMEKIVGTDKSVVAFTADWCNPCKQMKPHFARIGVTDSETNYFVVDVDKIPSDYINKYGIQSVPQILVLNKGEMIQKINGRTFDAISSELGLSVK